MRKENHTPTPMSAVGNLGRELNMPIAGDDAACGRGASICDKAAPIQSTAIEAGGDASLWRAAASAALGLKRDIVTS